MRKIKHNPRGAGPHDKQSGVIMRALRIQKGFSQLDLAEKMGISFQQIQKYEKGTNRMTVSRLKQLSGILDVSPLELMGWDGSPKEMIFDRASFESAIELNALPKEVRPMARQIITMLHDAWRASGKSK